jgi:hypothetical protein
MDPMEHYIDHEMDEEVDKEAEERALLREQIRAAFMNLAGIPTNPQFFTKLRITDRRPGESAFQFRARREESVKRGAAAFLAKRLNVD